MKDSPETMSNTWIIIFTLAAADVSPLRGLKPEGHFLKEWK